MSSTGPLDLSNADLAGFEALDAGRYDAEIFAITMDAVKNTDGTGKMPSGTPQMKVQFKLTGEGVENRRVFTQFTIPPKGYDKDKAAIMTGFIARFFVAAGDKEEVVKSKSFQPEFDDYIGRPVVVVLSKEEYPKGSDEYQNSVKGVKKAGSGTSSDSGLL